MFKGIATAICVCVWSFSMHCFAVDVSNGTYRPLPPGTDLVLWYEINTRSSEFKPDGQKTLKNGTNLDVHISMFRYIHFMEIGGYTVSPQILLPYGKVYDARIGGRELDDAVGMMDTMVTASIWLINEPGTGPEGRFFSVTPILYLPLGSYHKGDATNLGENRYKLETHFNFVQPLWGPTSLDVTGGITVYGDNDEAGDGSQKLKQDPSVSVQAYFSTPLNPTQTFALGFAAEKGGKQYLDDTYLRQKNDYKQLRVEFLQRFSQRTSAAISLSRDIDVEGGFKRDLGVTLVGMYAF
ncbi:transporter [Pseudomonas azotoformans]